MPVLVLKLVFTPFIVGGATLAARRWGPAIGGLLIALPLTSGPVAFFLALDQGPAFAAAAIEGSLGGLTAIAGFTLAYAALARRGPAMAIVVASAAYVAAAVAVQPLVGGPAILPFGLALVAVTVVLRLLPPPAPRRARSRPPAWDLPARMIVGTVLIVGLTSVASTLGASVSGVVATFPVYVSIIATFSHATEGSTAATGVLRGLLIGLYGTAAFMLVVNLAIVPAGIGPAFAGATALALVIAAGALRVVRGAGEGDGAAPVEPEPA